MRTHITVHLDHRDRPPDWLMAYVHAAHDVADVAVTAGTATLLAWLDEVDTFYRPRPATEGGAQ